MYDFREPRSLDFSRNGTWERPDSGYVSVRVRVRYELGFELGLGIGLGLD